MRVAIIEDDSEHSAILNRLFLNEGSTPELFMSGGRFLCQLHRDQFDLALLDLRLPDLSGIDVLKALRREASLSRHRLPVMVVTGCGETSAMQEAFDCGASDYLLKPVRADELLVRARARARALQPRLLPDQPLEAGPLWLDLASQQARLDGQPIELTDREFKLLWLLLHKMGRPVSRKEILSAVWGMGSGPGGPQSRSLDTHIGRLRSKLGLHTKRASQAAGGGPSIRLDAVYGMGYQIDVFP